MKCPFDCFECPFKDCKASGVVPHLKGNKSIEQLLYEAKKGTETKKTRQKKVLSEEERKAREREKNRRYRQNNKEKLKEYYKQYRKKNPEKFEKYKDTQRRRIENENKSN